MKNVSDIVNYAIERMPSAIVIVDSDGRIRWHNEELAAWLGFRPEIGTSVKNFWPKMIVTPIWGTEGEYIFQHDLITLNSITHTH